jgi:hypothetical protein
LLTINRPYINYLKLSAAIGETGLAALMKRLQVNGVWVFSGSSEFGSERIPRSLLRGKRANDERHCSLRIEDSPQLAAESFNKISG